MRQIVVVLTLIVGLATPALADQATAIRTLAEQGDAEAQFALGTMYRDGQGVEQDYAEALRWWNSAADLGLADAQFALGNIYAGGAGIPQDDVLAYKWYDIVASRSEEDWLHAIAGSNRDALAARMSPEDIAKAQQLVVEWRAKVGK